MIKSREKMRWILFYVFIILFVIITICTIILIFFDFGAVKEKERELLFQVFIGEIGIGVVGLFYSLFGLKKGNTNDAGEHSNTNVSSKNESNEEELLEHYNSELEILDDMSEIRSKIAEIFSNSNKVEFIQTFIKTNSLPPILDKARDYYNIFKKENGKLEVKLERLICISHPKEIYFISESLKLSEKMGNYFNVSLFDLNGNSESPLHTFPNFTLDNDNVLISFPLEQDINNRQINYPLFSDDNSIESSGIFVKNEKFNKSARKYLKVITEQIRKQQNTSVDQVFEEAKERLWKTNPLEYLDSIARDICKELLKTKNIKESIQYLGIVGSLVELLNCDNSRIPNDIDIMLCVENISVEKYKTIEYIVNNILEAYSHNIVKFYSLFSATPSKAEFTSVSKEFPVQILIYNKRTINQLSPFVASQRLKGTKHITYKGKIEEFILTQSFSMQDIVDKTFGIDSTIKSISNKTYKIFGESWIIEGDSISYKIKPETILNEKNKKSFCKYSIKWNTINTIEASDTIIPKGISSIEDKLNWMFHRLNLVINHKTIITEIILDKSTKNYDLQEIENCTKEYLLKLKELIVNS